MTNHPVPSDSPSSAPQNTNFTPTARLLEFLEIFKGGTFTADQISQVNDGRLDYVVGDVLLQNYQKNLPKLVQVRIKTEEEGIFILTSNEGVALDPNIFVTLGNTYLIKRPREIWISNLGNPDFQEIFNEAAQFRQRVACVYSRISGEIVLLSVISSYSQYAPPQATYKLGVGQDDDGIDLPPKWPR